MKLLKCRWIVLERRDGLYYLARIEDGPKGKTFFWSPDVADALKTDVADALFLGGVFQSRAKWRKTDGAAIHKVGHVTSRPFDTKG